MPTFNTVPGLIPLKIFNGNNLITSNINLINFTGSGVTASVGEFNNLIVTIGGGGTTVSTGSLLLTASFSNPNLTFTKGDGSTFNVNLSTLVPTSASYALTASFATSASFAPSTPPFPFTGSALITGSLGVTGSVSVVSANTNYSAIGTGHNIQFNRASELGLRIGTTSTDTILQAYSSITGSSLSLNPFGGSVTINAATPGQHANVNLADGNTQFRVYRGASIASGITMSQTTGGSGVFVIAHGDTTNATGNANIVIAQGNTAVFATGKQDAGTTTKNHFFGLSYGTITSYNTLIGSSYGGLGSERGIAFSNSTQAGTPDRIQGVHVGGAKALSLQPYGGNLSIGNITPTAKLHVKGESDTVDNVFVAENLSNTANLTISNSGVSTFTFGSGGKVFINAPVGAGDILLEIRRSTSSSGGFIFRSNNGTSQSLETTNGAFGISTVDNSSIVLTPGTAAVLLNTTVNNYNTLNSTGIQFRVGTQANSSLDRWLNFGHNTNYGQILQAVQNGATPAIDRLAINPYGGITTLCGELPNSFVDVLVSSGTGLRVYRGSITNGISFKVGNATGFGMLITHEDTTNTSGYANIQIIQGTNAVFSAGRANSGTLNNFYGNAYGTIDSYAMMVGVKYDYSANTTRGITFSATNTSTNANIIQSVHDGVGKPLSLNPYGGNVSIGNVISPSASLHVRAGSTGSVFQLDSNTSASIFTVNNNGSSSFNGSLTVGSATTSSNTENTLNIYPPPAGGTGEGGQILFAASGGLYTSASMIDNYQNQFRILKGTNTGGSTTGYFTMNLDTGASQFLGPVTASAYSGLPNDYLYVTRNTNQTIGSGTWANRDIIFNNIDVTKGIAYNVGTGLASLTGGKIYRITARLAWSAAAPYLLQYSCYTSADTQIGPTVEIVQSTNTSNNISDGTLDFIYAPGSNTDIKIRTTNNTSALTGEFIRGDLNTQLIIQQIA